MTTTCSECGATNPDGLGEEERAAWEAYREGHKRAFPPGYKLCSIEDANGVVKMLALDIYRAARAPLEAKVRELEAELVKLKAKPDPFLELANAVLVAQEREKYAAKRIAELEAQLPRAQKRSVSLQSDLTFAAELLGTADPTARAANLETAVDLLKRLARDESPIVREGAKRGLEILQAQKPAVAKGLPEIGTPIDVCRTVDEYGRFPHRDVVAAHIGPSEFEISNGERYSMMMQNTAWRRIPPAQTSREPAASTPGKPEYWQALRWAAGRVSSRGDSQVSSESAAPFYALAREIEGAIQKEWGMNGPGSEPASSPPTATPDGVTMENLDNLRKRWGTPFGIVRDGELLTWEREFLKAVAADIKAAQEMAKPVEQTSQLIDALGEARDLRVAMARAEKRSAERIAELQGKFEHTCGVAGILREELAAGKAEVTRLTGEMERAKTPKRCPADGMKMSEVGGIISAKLGGYGTVEERYQRAGATARELFTPVADKPSAKGAE